MTGHDLFRPIVEDAVEVFGAQSAPLFDVLHFAAAVWRDFKLEKMPPLDKAEAILEELPFVRRLSGGMWVYLPEANDAPEAG